MRTLVLYLLLVCSVVFVAVPDARAQAFAYRTIAGAVGLSGSADGTNGVARFYEPGNIAVDAGGNLYVADSSSHTIRKVAPAGNNWVVSTLAGSPGKTGTNDGPNSTARFFFPYGIAVDSATNLYVADTYNDTIRRLTLSDTNWIVSTVAGVPRSTGTNDGPGSTAQFNFPYGVAVDTAGRLFVADTYNHAIRMLTPAGGQYGVSTIAGLPGIFGFIDGSNTMAHFDHPFGLAVDGADNVYVADTYNCTLRRVAPSGSDWVVTTLAGLAGNNGSADGTNRNASFQFPGAVAVDGAGNLFVADTYNDAIRKVTAFGTNSVVSTVGGMAGATGSADGVGSAAQFFQPQGVVVDTAGNLYVADSFNDTIRFGRLGYTLQGSLVGGQFVVSWSAAATNYLLETASSVAAGAFWTPVTNGIVQSGNSFVRTNTLGAVPAFYRLHKP